MMLVALGAIVLVTFEILYVLTNIWEMHIGHIIGTLIILLGIIQLMIYFKNEDKKTIKY